MKLAMMGVAMLAVSSLPAVAQGKPSDATVWIGVDGTEDGFLLDAGTGALWLTGVCIKSVGTAVQSGTVWQARLVELVSVGRGRTQLDQTFILDLSEASPSITVENPDRGGRQTINQDVIVLDCDRANACQRVLDSPTC